MSASDWVISRVMGFAIPLWFDGASADDLAATFELRVRTVARRRAVPLTLQIGSGRCRVARGAPPKAGAIATVSLRDMLRLVLGRTGWPQLMSSGRLELSGDPFLALRFPSLFRLPATAGR